MGKRTRRQRSPEVIAPERLLLEATADGELDDHLTALAEAVDARRQLLHTVRSATVCAGLNVR